MSNTDPVEILLATNRWATENIVAACKELSDEQFHRRYQIGWGSLHNSLIHILESMQHWADALAGRQPTVLDHSQSTPPLLVGSFGIVYFGAEMEDQKRTPQQVSDLLNQICDELETAARNQPLDTQVIWKTDRIYVFTRAEVLTHVTTHGVHHRAQCLNMLRQLGVQPLPACSVHEWMIESSV